MTPDQIFAQLNQLLVHLDPRLLPMLPLTAAITKFVVSYAKRTRPGLQGNYVQTVAATTALFVTLGSYGIMTPVNQLNPSQIPGLLLAAVLTFLSAIGIHETLQNTNDPTQVLSALADAPPPPTILE